MQRLRRLGARQPLVPFAALSASYFAHIGFFNPYLSLWLKDLGYGLFAIGLLTFSEAVRGCGSCAPRTPQGQDSETMASRRNTSDLR